MLLVIDIGNTNICGGVYRDGTLIHSLRIHTVPKKTEDEYAILFKAILADRGVLPSSIDRVVLSSVVPVLTIAVEAMCAHLFGTAPIVLGPEIYANLPLSVPKPREIRDDAILGVAIVPGLGTAVNALSRDTAQLPHVQLAAPESVIGTDTVMSIQAGVVHGYVGLVEHLVGKMKAEIGGSASVIATGGLCRIIAGLSDVFDEIDPDLTLDGLALVAEYA
jgi:type III pantothenate kinase